MSYKAFLIIVCIILLVGFGWLIYTWYAEDMEITKHPPLTPPPAPNTLITVSSPPPNTLVSSPLAVTGQARGQWYFEASFPVKLYDADGNLLATGVAQALSDWMTTDFVPFSAILTFSAPSTATGTLVLEKDNPSGLPENDDSISIPVNF